MSLTPDEAARQIDHGLALWEQHPRAREVRWEDGRRVFRLRATTLRYLLDWHWKGRPGWRPAYYRWNA